MLYRFTVLFSIIFLLRAEGIFVRLVNAVTGSPLHHVQCDIGQDIAAITDSFGRIILPDSLPSNSITINCESYHSEQFTDEIPTFVKLKPILFEHELIEVEGFRNQSRNDLRHPVALTEIEYNDHSAKNIESIFSQLPGLIVKSYGGVGGVKTISLNGSQGDRIQLQLNGTVINNKQSGNADISQLPSAMVEKLQFIPMGSGSRYGNSAMAGVINVVSLDEPLSISIKIRNAENKDLSFFKNFSSKFWSVGIGAGSSSQFQTIPWTETGDYNPSEYEHGRYDWFSSSLVQNFVNFSGAIHGLGYSLKFNAMKIDNNRNLSGKVYYGENHPKLEDGLELLSFRYNTDRLDFGISHKFQSILYHSNSTDSPPIFADHKLGTTIIRTERIRKQSSTFSEWKISRSISSETQPADTSILQYGWGYTNRKISKYLNIFISYRLQVQKHETPIQSWELILDKFLEISPIRTSLVISKNFKKPGFNDLFWKPFGNDKLKTETSKNIYAKAEYSKGGLTFNMTAFRIRYNDLIQWLPQTGGSDFWRPENVNAARSEGYTIGLSGNSRYADRWLVTVTNTNFTNEITNEQLPYSPNWISSLIFQKSIGLWDFSGQIHSISKRMRSITQYDGTPWFLPGYSLLNLNIGRSIVFKGFRWTSGISINNLLDMRYQSVYGYPEPGRIINFNLTLKQKES